MESLEGDPLIPILNLVCMLIPLLLYGAVFVKFHTLTVNAPEMRDGLPPQDTSIEPLALMVMITDQGFHIKVNPKYRLPWMNAATQGSGGDDAPDVPKTEDGFDFAGLVERLEEIKREHREETLFYLGAEDQIEYDVIIQTMDHARGTAGRLLFPHVTLTRGLV